MRPPEVFVRPLAHGEAVTLKRRAKRAEHFSTRQRASILLASNAGMSAPAIAHAWQTDESHVRKVSMSATSAGWTRWTLTTGAGAPPDHRRSAQADRGGSRCPSRHAGEPFMRWSLIKLARYLRERGICEISHLGRVLARAGLSFQRTRSWRASPDPDYEAKAQRVLELHERAPTGGAVISFDQMGTISLRPTHGCRWPGGSARSACGQPSNAATACATASAPWTCTPTGCGCGLRRRGAGSDTLAFMRQVRPCYPHAIRLYWIQDNLSANWTPDASSPLRATSSSCRCPPTPAT